MKWLPALFLFPISIAFAQTGPFSSTQIIPFDSVRSLAAADINKDNIADLVVANYNDQRVSLLIGNGAGSFSQMAGSPFSMGPKPVRAVVGDFNKDARIDIAVLNEIVQFPVSGGFQSAPGVSVYLGTASGFSIAPGTPLQLQGTGVSELLVRDVNADGNPDVIAVTSTPNVIFGNGAGGFGTPVVAPAGSFPGATSAAAADFNGDGKSDLAYALTGAPDETGVLLGDVQGRFLQSFGVLLSGAGRDLFSSPWRVTGFATADINGDGFQDLLGASSGRSVVFTWLGSTSGMQISSSAPNGTPAGDAPNALVLADFNGDGKLDFAATNPTPSTISMGLGTGSGFAPATGSPFPMGSHPLTLATADFNRDGQPDLAIADENGITILLNTGALAASRAPQTISFAPLPGVPLGTAPFTVSATASSGLPVTFSTTSTACSVSGNTVTLLTTGFCAITASQAGNSVFAPAQTVQSFTIGGPPSQTITFATLPDRELATGSFTVSATASSALTVTFSSATPATCSVSGTTVTLIAGGTCTITANQAGNANFSPATPVSRTFTITVGQRNQVITAATPLTYSLSVGSVQLSVTANSGLPVTLTSTTPELCTTTVNMVQLLAAGQCSITATQPGNAQFLPAEPLIIRINITPALAAPVISSVLNGASYAADRIAPNSYVTIFGKDFGGGPRLTIRDSQNNPIFVTPSYASETQINFVWPASFQPGQAVVNVASSAGSANTTVTVAPIAPAIFTADSTGAGLAAAQVLTVRPGQAIVTKLVTDGPIPVPANGDVYLVLYGTGIRNRSGSVVARMGDYTGDVLYAGAQSTFPGLDQVNIKVPVGLAGKGRVDIQLVVDGVITNTVTALFQ